MDLDRPNKAEIERVCRTFGDTVTMEVFANLYVIRKAGLYGRAHKHLAHFLEGSGRGVRFDLEQLIKDVSSVKDRIVSEVRRSWKTGLRHGRVEVTQRNYNALTQKQLDWQYALGGFFVAWRTIASSQNRFHLTVVNEYGWNPQDRDLTRCIHEAGQRLNASGRGRNFRMMGECDIEFDPTL